MTVILVTLLSASPAGAYRHHQTAGAETDADHVDYGLGDQIDLAPGGSSGHASCEWHADLFSDSGGQLDLPLGAIENERASDDDQLYVVSCGTYAGLRWIGSGGPDVRPVANELVRRLTVNDGAIKVRPDGRAITGIPSYFWVEGYGAAPLQGTESAFGLTVTVTIQLVGVEWDFGDGTPVVHAGLGEAWPQRSSVNHNYRYAAKDPLTVTATLLFQPTYTVNGVAGVPLEPIRMPTSRPYLVHQLQAERTR